MATMAVMGLSNYGINMRTHTPRTPHTHTTEAYGMIIGGLVLIGADAIVVGTAVVGIPMALAGIAMLTDKKR